MRDWWARYQYCAHPDPSDVLPTSEQEARAREKGATTLQATCLALSPSVKANNLVIHSPSGCICRDLLKLTRWDVRARGGCDPQAG